MVIVLLATMGVMIQSAVNAWLKEKSYQVVDVSHALHQRIDAWRYATWQIYDNIAATSVNTASGGPAGDAFKTGRLLPGETPA